MNNSVRVLFICLVTFASVSTTPQIFTEVHKFCRFDFNGRNLAFPDNVWAVNGGRFSIYFSFCESPHHRCQNKTSSCLIYERSNQIIDLGDQFLPDDDKFSLESINGDRCQTDPNRNFSLVVSLQCSHLSGPRPRLTFSDECTFEISAMSPDCEPKCTQNIQNSYLLDIRNFPKNILINSDSRNFSLNLCASNNLCSRGISACEISDEGGSRPLATTESLHLNYDINKNEMTARGRYGKIRMVVLIKCNWQSIFTNAIYKKVAIQGSRYSFEVESSFGCVKLPQSCALTDVDNFSYNLEKLSRDEGWTVSNVTEGKIVINVCGPLNGLESVCADEYSQVCHINNTQYRNMGSVRSSLQMYDERIRAVFVSGSTCQENPRLLYSTVIHFKCTRTEKGPVFGEYRDCVMFLTWETPHACPVAYYKGSKCLVNNKISYNNLQPLYSQNDRTYTPSSGTTAELVYNLCGPIHDTCNNFTNVSFCLKTEDSETVIGWENDELISENGALRMELLGAQCSNTGQGKVTVDFVCTHQDPPPNSEMTVIEHNCKYNLTIFTRFACFSQKKFSSCVHTVDNKTYDLSPLISTSKNYIIQGDSDVEYIFNLCGPIISGPEALCGGDTMFCLRNKTEANVKKQYVPLGGIASPKLHNLSLVIESTMGSFCREQGHYKSVIGFECSNKKFQPTFLLKDTCTFYFKWETPEACPREDVCIINGTTSNSRMDLTNLQIKIIKFNIDNKTHQYEFHVCQDIYTLTSNGKKTTATLRREFLTVEGSPLLILDLRRSCNRSDEITKVIIKMQCSENLSDYFEKTSLEQCILNVTLYTKTACPLTNFQYSPGASRSYEENEPDAIEYVPRNFRKESCPPIEARNGFTLNLSEIESQELIFGGNRFTINFQQQHAECNAFFCRNSMPLIEEICPVISFNYSNHLVTLEYLSSLKQCNSNEFHYLKLLLKCNKTKSHGTILKNELCNVVAEYDIPAVCNSFAEEPNIGSATVIAISAAVIFVAFFIFVAYIIRRRLFYVRYFPFVTSKTHTQIYCRDSTE